MWFLFIITAFVIYYLYKNKRRKQVTKVYEDNPEESRALYSEFIKQNKDNAAASEPDKKPEE